MEKEVISQGMLNSMQTGKSHKILESQGISDKCYLLFLAPANEVWGKVIFSVACVKDSLHGGGGGGLV